MGTNGGMGTTHSTTTPSILEVMEKIRQFFIWNLKGIPKGYTKNLEN